jgi:NAD+ synthetase
VARKALLPTYDVFDEWRYFRPGDPVLIEIAGQPIGVTVCEDIWDEGYARHPVRELAERGAELLINLSASPYHQGQLARRLAVLQRHAAACGLPQLYCNMVGGQDELVFDGRSLALAADGKVHAQAAAWESDLLVVDTAALADAAGTSGDPAPVEPDPDPAAEEALAAEELFAALVLGLRDYARKCGFSSAVLGLSGGVDSALVACIAAQALGADNVTALAMPSRHTAQMSNDDAGYLAQRLGIELFTLPIEDSVALAEARFCGAFGAYRSRLTRENLQSRERGKTLMEFSNDRGALLLATGNKTEYALGYSTLYGDMCGGLAVIGDLNKLEVYALARWFNAASGREIIPQRTLEREPSAELADGQVDPFDYAVIAPLADLVIEDHLSVSQLVRRGFPAAEVQRVLRLVRLSEYKRKQAPPILRVSAKAFGIGRRMPIVNTFE